MHSLNISFHIHALALISITNWWRIESENVRSTCEFCTSHCKKSPTRDDAAAAAAEYSCTFEIVCLDFNTSKANKLFPVEKKNAIFNKQFVIFCASIPISQPKKTVALGTNWASYS